MGKLFSRCYFHFYQWIFLLLIVNLPVKLRSIQAQIIPDNSLGAENSRITPQQMRDLIEGGATRGSNLFHSFREFNVNSGQQVYFVNPQNITNIFTRVTGDNLSQILGTLGVNGNANLFLLNPNGIFLGQGAKLDLNGVFFATTADSILFANGIEFSATNPQAPPLLTINVPLGIQFNDNSIRGNITSQQATLEVKPQQTLGLIGGDLNLKQTTLTAEGGYINLVSISDRTTLEFSDFPLLLIPDTIAKGDIQITNNSLVDVIGGNQGNINIEADNFTLTASQLTAGITNEDSNNNPNSWAGDITIKVTNDINFSEDSLISNILGANTIGNGGDIIITANNLFLNDSRIVNSINGAGNGGDIQVTARNRIESISSPINFTLGVSGRKGFFSQAQPQSQQNAQAGDVILQAPEIIFLGLGGVDGGTLGAGNGGIVELKVDRLELLSGATIINNTNSSGDAGDIKIRATDSILINDLLTNSNDNLVTNPGGIAVNVRQPTGEMDIPASGNAGTVDIETNQLTITNGGLISASTSSVGNAGSISIKAQESIKVIGGKETETRLRASQISTAVRANGIGAGGDLSLQTNNLILEQGGLITAGTQGQGDGGNIDINSNNVILNGSQILASSTDRGRAGNININASESVVLRGIRGDGTGSSIGSQVFRLSGDAGDITINTNALKLFDGALLSASTAGAGNAGKIIINAIESIILRGENGLEDDAESFIKSQVLEGARGNSRGIEINTGKLTLLQGAEISASTFGIGNSGKVIVNATESITLEQQNSLGESSEISSEVEPNAQGSSAGVILNTKRFVMKDEAEISTSTKGVGNAGTIDIIATESFLVQGEGTEIESAVEVDDDDLTIIGRGNSGNITIISDRVTLLDQGRITASTFGFGDAGNIDIITDEFVLDNSLIDVLSVLTGNAGNISITANESLTLIGTRFDRIQTDIINSSIDNGIQAEVFDFGIVSVSTANGNAGNISLNTNDFMALNGALLTANTFGKGEGGLISIEAVNQITLDKSAILSATFSNAPAGSIDLQSKNLNAFQAQVLTSTFSGGLAGNINVNATESVNLFNKGLDNSPTIQGIFAATSNSLSESGKGGNITIDSREINLLEGAGITVAGLGLGDAGEITLNANILKIQNGGVAATSNSGEGGNLQLNIGEQINLFDGSEITARAGLLLEIGADGNVIFQENSGGGNGGNIIINSPIIIAFPKQINEITANASTGNGGNINITTQSILGSDFLNINASSQLGIDGVVEITNPNVDPISGVELQTQKPQDTSNQIIAGCSAEQGNRLVIQGKGGLPENPTQPFNGEIIWEDLRIFSPDSEINNSQKYDNNFTSGKHNLQPAQDWLIKNDGTVILTSKRISNRNMIGLNSTHNCTNIFVN